MLPAFAALGGENNQLRKGLWFVFFKNKPQALSYEFQPFTKLFGVYPNFFQETTIGNDSGFSRTDALLAGYVGDTAVFSIRVEIRSYEDDLSIAAR
jgi:hypothetical protein